jgi:hypothetical protein
VAFPTDRQQQRDAAALAARLEALQLPVVPLRRHAYLGLPLAARNVGFQRVPAAVGFGPREDAVALYRRRDGGPGAVVLHVREGGTEERVLPSVGDRVKGVQPLSNGSTAVLVEDTFDRDPLTCATTLVTLGADGVVVAKADAGPDTVALLATTDDRLWVGYGDLGHYANHPLAADGLAEFDTLLTTPRPWRASDLALLNVTDDVVYAAGYAREEFLRISGDSAHSYATGWQTYSTLLVDGNRGVLVGGSLGLSHDDIFVRPGVFERRDVAVPVTIDDSGLHVSGPGVRLVAPNGQELPGHGARTTRGPHLHVVADHGREWWRIGLDDLPFSG